MDLSKPFYESKIFWINFLIPVSVYLLPQYKEIIVNNLEASSFLWGIVNIALRFITKKEVTIS